MEERIARLREAVRATPDDAADATRRGLIPLPSCGPTAWDRGNLWAVSVLYRLKPRLSLLIGSLLMLLTLYVQGTAVVFEVATKENIYIGGGRGYFLFLAGREAMWWSSLDFLSHYAGEGFYTLCLVLAAFTLLFLLAAWRRPELLRKQNISRGLFVVAASLALFFVSDFLLAWVLFLLDPGELTGRLSFTIPLVPLVLWYRHHFSTRSNVRSRWPRVRDGVTVLYIPVVLADCICMALFGFWGLLVYLAGITLISLGYLQLAKGSNPSLASQSIQREGQTQ